MVVVGNLGRNLSEVFHSESNLLKGEAKEWRLIGQEQDGTILVSFVAESSSTGKQCTCVGQYLRCDNKFKVVHVFNSLVNVVQATLNHTHTLLGFVLKQKVNPFLCDGDGASGEEAKVPWLEVYKPYLVALYSQGPRAQQPRDLGLERSHQIMVQFLYRRKDLDYTTHKLLVLVHQEAISLNHVQLKKVDESHWELDGPVTSESLVRAFTWAQWAPTHQALYYIHYRRIQASVEGEPREEELSPTLSCLQFHDDTPHETVLNIPLNLPQLPRSGGILCGVYEDDPVPLRVHDCSLDLQVVSDSKGVVCICHHYLYQPVKPPVQAGGGDMSNTVHFAYSVTLLHHGCVIHCVVPGIPWSDARTMKPTFVLHGDQHMLVYAPGLFTHLLDIGLSHEPCCHILTSPHLPGMPSHVTHLVPLFQTGNNVTTVDLPSLDLVSLAATTAHLVDTFRSDNSLGNRLAILHYFLVHQGDFETVAELLMPVVERPLDLSVSQLLQEVLIGGAYASAQRNLPSDATALMLLLPLTSGVPAGELHVKVNRLSMSVTQEMLWNTAMMLLSPQQRVVPYRADMWTRLWEQLTKKTGKDRPRFRPSQVADKLMVSLVCYQPEALSRSSTPLSPGTSLVGSGTLGELANMAAGGWGKADNLPFFEMESCTASKQEHVISVNLRELSMHLLKNTTKQQTPLHVHVVATQYCAAQLELSRLLCQLLCHCASVDARQEQEYGFALVDQLDEGRRYVLFVLLERFYLAVNSLAFPLPQGFTSFFTFLGYRTLAFPTFLQYTQRNTFELQVDVMKAIMADMDDTTEGVQRKLRLLLLLPRSRAKRLLNQWVHPVSLMLRAREHALNILSGVEGAQARGHPPQSVRTAQLGSRGLAAFPSADRLSPLDTFLDLLTAKASLAELDFGLLIEATITSTEEFLE